MDTTLPNLLSVYNTSGIKAIWDETLTTNTFIAAKSITSLVDVVSGHGNNLTLGATCNVDVTAVRAINMSTPDGLFFNYPTVGEDGHTVTENVFLKTFLSQDTSQTRMEAPHQDILMAFSNQMTMNSFFIKSPATGNYDTIGTNKSSLVIKNNTSFSSNVAILGNSITYGSIFGQNFNLWTDKTVTNNPHDLSKVGYGFRINSNDQLELIKMSYFNDMTVANKRIAIFGMMENVYGCNDSSSNYLVLNALNSNADASASNPYKAGGSLVTSPSPLDGYIFMNNSNVGIGTTTAEYGLDVRTSSRFTSNVLLQGGFTFTGSLIPALPWSTDLGSSNIKMTNIYCSSNLNVGNINLQSFPYENVLRVCDSNGALANVTAQNIVATVDIVTPSITSTDAIIENLYVSTYIVTPGQDYAEYMRKSDASIVYAPGQVIGIDTKGELTDKFADSIHFKVVSSSPSIIGGYTDTTDEFLASNEKIAYCGRVPVITTMIPKVIGSYIVPVQGPDGSIATQDVEPANMTLHQYMSSVGQVISMSNNVPTIIVR